MDVHFKLKEWFLAMGFHREDLPPDWKFKDMCRGKYAMVFENMVRLVKPKREIDEIKKLLFVHDMKQVILNEEVVKKRTVHEPSSYTLWRERKILQDKLSVLEQRIKSKEKHILSSNESLKEKAVSRLELTQNIKNDHRKLELLKYKAAELHHDLKLVKEMCSKAATFISQRSSLDEKKSTLGRRKNKNPEEIVNSCLAKVNDVWKVKFYQAQENHKDVTVRHNDTMLSGNTSILSSTKCFGDRNEDYSTQMFPNVEFEARDEFELSDARKFLNNYLDTNIAGLSGNDIWTSLTEHQESIVKTLTEQAMAVEVQENEDINRSLPREMLSRAYLTHSDLVLQTLQYEERHEQAKKQRFKLFKEYFGNTLPELFSLKIEQAELEATIQVFKEEQEDLASSIVSHPLQKQIEALTSEIIHYDKLCLTKKSEIEQAIARIRTLSPKLTFVHKKVNDFLNSLNGAVLKTSRTHAAPNIKIQVNDVTSSENDLEAAHTYEDFVNDMAGIGNGTAENHPAVQLLPLRHYFADKTKELARIQAKTFDTSFTRELGVDSALETTGDVADMPVVNLADELKYFDRCFPLDKNRKLFLTSGRAIWITESLSNSLQQIAHDIVLESSIFNPLLSPNSFLMRTQVQIALLKNLKEVFENAYGEEEDIEEMDISPLVTEYDQRVDTMKKKLSEVVSSLKKVSRQLEITDGTFHFWTSGKIRSFINPSRKVAGKSLHEYQTQYDAILSGRYGSAF